MPRLVRRILPNKPCRMIRLHLFVRDEAGPIQTSGRVFPSSLGPIRMGGSKGRIACGTSDAHGNVIVEMTDDVRVATCPECLATETARAMLANYETILTTEG